MNDSHKFTLIEGNPIEPSSGDLLSECVTLPGIERPYMGDIGNSGWRILTGNNMFNLWGRVVYRYEIEG